MRQFHIENKEEMCISPQMKKECDIHPKNIFRLFVTFSITTVNISETVLRIETILQTRGVQIGTILI